MDKVLKQIINDYITEVDMLCTNMLKELGLRDKIELLTYIRENRIWELDINGINYKFHGAGCDAFYEDGAITWDFGRYSHWCRIDPWFVAGTLKSKKSEYTQFYDGEIIRKACEEAVVAGELYRVDTCYYFTIPMEETFKPDFPKDFDSLIIEYFDEKWQILRNKEIDRFLRKSTFVHRSAYENPYKYTLRFMLGDENVYTVPYVDVCYPSNAVLIMSHNILRKLRKG